MLFTQQMKGFCFLPNIKIKYLEIPKADFLWNYSLLSCVWGSDLFVAVGEDNSKQKSLQIPKKKEQGESEFYI